MAEETKNQGLARFQATVHGRVQGVGFRYFVLDNAQRLKLTGWVRNRYSGTVEAVAEGSRSSLEQLLSALGRGPVSAHVTEVEHEWQEATGEFERFRVRLTG